VVSGIYMMLNATEWGVLLQRRNVHTP